MILFIFAIHLKHVIILLATMFTLFPFGGNEDHIRSCPVHAVYSTPSVSAWQPQSSLGHIHVLAGTMSRAGKLLMCDRHSLKPINPSPSYLNLGLIWRVIVSRQVKPCAFLLDFYQAPAQRDLRAIHSGGGKKMTDIYLNIKVTQKWGITFSCNEKIILQRQEEAIPVGEELVRRISIRIWRMNMIKLLWSP